MNNILATLKSYAESSVTSTPYIYGDDAVKFNVEIIDLNGRPTRNGVIYPIEEFKKALNAPDVVQRLKTGSLYGEYDHPIDPNDLKRWMRQEMPYVTHKWNKFWFEGTKLMGECQTFTGNGNLMGHAIKGGELPSFSIRVLGNPTEQNGNVVLKDIVLSSIDWVRYPGNPTSYVEDSNAFEIAPNYLREGFKLSDRSGSFTVRGESYSVVARAEAAGLINENEDLLNLDKGIFAKVEKISESRLKDLNRARARSFGF